MIHTGPPTREFIPCDPNRIRGAAFSGPSGSANRLRQLAAVTRVMPSCSAITRLLTP